MKIIFIQTEGGIGGAEMCLLDVIATLRSARPDWEITVVLGDRGPIERAIAELGAGVVLEPAPRSFAKLGDAGLQGKAGAAVLLGRSVVAGSAIAGYIARLRRTIRSLKPDIVQSNGMKAHVLASFAVSRSIPLVWHMHDYISSRAIMCKILRTALAARRGGSTTIVGVSRSVAADAERALAGSRRGVSAASSEDSARKIGDSPQTGFDSARKIGDSPQTGFDSTHPSVGSGLRRGVTVQTIHNAVDIDRFKPCTAEESAIAAAALDRASGFGPAPEGTVRVGLIATFAIWKGHEVFLEAARMLDFSRPIRLYIIGGPIYRSTGSQHTVEALRGRIDVLGLRDRVGLTGHIAEPAEAIRGVDVVVHASVRPEPFGRVIVEGMASGKGVIVSVPADDWKGVESACHDRVHALDFAFAFDRGGFEPSVSASGATELFRNGIDALGAPAGDPAALAAAIDRLASDHELRNKLGNEGRRAAIDRFDRRKLAEKWLPLYDPRESSVP